MNREKTMEIQIQNLKTLPQQIEQLAMQAKQENIDFLQQLIEQYQQGKITFTEQGEFFLAVYYAEKLIGCGALQQQWNKNEKEHGIGCVNYFYLLPDYRQYGIGKKMLRYLEQHAICHFSALCLQTETTLASQFYQKMNYVFVENNPNYNYFKYLI